MELDELSFGTFNGDKLYLYDADKKVQAKECGKCCKVRDINLFSPGNRIGGKNAWCKDCHAEDKRKRYEADPEHFATVINRWKSNNPEKHALIVKLAAARRRARLAALPHNFSSADFESMFDHFEGACALTGVIEDLHADHAIPIAIGHGGTVIGNMIPLRGDLNKSKNARNLFEWFRKNKKRFNLSQSRFDATIEYLAKLNGMTSAEYRDYVYYCHANPRDVADAV